MKKIFLLLSFTLTANVALSIPEEDKQVIPQSYAAGLNSIKNAALFYTKATVAFTLSGAFFNDKKMTYACLEKLNNNNINIWVRKETNMIVPYQRYFTLTERLAYILLSLGSAASLPLRSPYNYVSWAKKYASTSKQLKNPIPGCPLAKQILLGQQSYALKQSVKCTIPLFLGFGIPFMYGYYKEMQNNTDL